jgi:sn-glycerol 3-phosphate transport system permease protein
VFHHRFLPYLLVLPQLAVVGVFFLWPALRAGTEAFERSNAFGLGTRFSGFANFVSVVTNGDYVQSIEVTVIFAASTTVFAMAIGLFLAVEVEQIGRGRALYRTLFLWTYAVPGAIAGALWLFLFEPDLGPGARLLGTLGMKWNFALHGDQALGLVVALTVWQQSAYNFLFFTAALQGMPAAVHEAAAIDGAGPLNRFWRVTFPLLSPTTFFLSVMDVLYALFSSFAVIDVVTQGGPAGATTTLVYKLYQDGFQNADSGLAGAETVVLIAIAGALTVVQFRLLNRRVHYR